MIAGSVLPLGAAVYLPSAFPVLMILTVLLFVSGLIMLRLQTVRRAREQKRTQSRKRPEVRPTDESPLHEPGEMHGLKRSRSPMAQLQVEDR